MHSPPTLTDTVSRPFKLLFAAVFATQILGWFYVDGESRERRRLTRVEQVAGCDRGNVIRADRIIDSRDPDDTPTERRRVNAIFPLLDCPASRHGHQVKLAPVQRDAFIAIVERARIPVVRDGRVVGSTTP